MTKHTPGPYGVNTINGIVGVVPCGPGWSDDIQIAECREAGFNWHKPMLSDDDKKAEILANALFFAQAGNAHGDLLAACKAALFMMCGTPAHGHPGQDGTLGHHPDNPIPRQLRAAIAKAEPEES